MQIYLNRNTKGVVVSYTRDTLEMIMKIMKCSEDEAVKYLAAMAEVTHEKDAT